MTKTPGLYGDRLLPRDVVALLYGAGWKEPVNLVKMAATADAESDRFSAAVGSVNQDGSQDWGFLQLNNYHWRDFAATEEDFYQLCIDPPRASVAARTLFDKAKKQGGTGFEPWFAYGTQRYLDRLPAADMGLRNFVAVQLGIPLL